MKQMIQFLFITLVPLFIIGCYGINPLYMEQRLNGKTADQITEESNMSSCSSECDEQLQRKLRARSDRSFLLKFLPSNNFQYCTKKAMSEYTSIGRFFHRYDARYCAKGCYPKYCLPCKEKWCINWCSQVKASIEKCDSSTKSI